MSGSGEPVELAAVEDGLIARSPRASKWHGPVARSAGWPGAPLPLQKGNPMKTFYALSLGIGVLLIATHHAFAEGSQNCAERTQVVQRLAEGYGETRQSIGLGAGNRVVEVFASIETGTWTITVTHPNGITCMVASGQAFETINEELQPTSATDA